MTWTLPQQRIDVWHVPVAALDAAAVASCGALLAPEEAAQAARFRFEKDQRLSIVSRALVRRALAGYLGVQPQAIELQRTLHGKPFLKRPAGVPLQFNVSHTAGLVVAAFTLQHAVGIDVEHTQRQVRDLGLARRYFAPREADSLETLPDARRAEAFLRFWTLKEAYIKACGLGLAIPLDSFAFNPFGSGPPSISFANSPSDPPEHWQFAEFSLPPQHRVAVAAYCPHAQPLEVCVRPMRVPMEENEPG